jgi:hypothetical protein
MRHERMVRGKWDKEAHQSILRMGAITRLKCRGRTGSPCAFTARTFTT